MLDRAHNPPLPAGKSGAIWRFAILTAVLVLISGTLIFYRHELTIDALAAREAQWRAAVEQAPIASLAVAFALYVAVAGLSLPGATAMTVVCGWLFGFWRGLLLVSFASTAGATIAFLLSRYLLGEVIQSRYGQRLAALNAAIEREGAFYLFTLRLIPQVPFFVLNLTMGLTKIRVRTFWWVSQLGMLPATCVFVLAGAIAPSLSAIKERGLASILDWKLAVALTLLGVVPLVLKKVLGRYAHQSGSGSL